MQNPVSSVIGLGFYNKQKTNELENCFNSAANVILIRPDAGTRLHGDTSSGEFPRS